LSYERHAQTVQSVSVLCGLHLNVHPAGRSLHLMTSRGHSSRTVLPHRCTVTYLSIVGLSLRVPYLNFTANLWKNNFNNYRDASYHIYRGADKSLARPGRKQARKHVRDSCDFNNIETRAVIKLPHHPARQDAEGISRNSDRNISLFHS